MCLELLRLRVLLLVFRPEEIYIIVILFGVGSLRVDGKLRDLGAVGGVGFAWVTRERGELGLEGGNVLVPTVGVRVVLDLGCGLDGLEAFDIGLGWTVTSDVVSL